MTGSGGEPQSAPTSVGGKPCGSLLSTEFRTRTPGDFFKFSLRSSGKHRRRRRSAANKQVTGRSGVAGGSELLNCMEADLGPFSSWPQLG